MDGSQFQPFCVPNSWRSGQSFANQFHGIRRSPWSNRLSTTVSSHWFSKASRSLICYDIRYMTIKIWHKVNRQIHNKNNYYSYTSLSSSSLPVSCSVRFLGVEVLGSSLPIVDATWKNRSLVSLGKFSLHQIFSTFAN